MSSRTEHARDTRVIHVCEEFVWSRATWSATGEAAARGLGFGSSSAENIDDEHRPLLLMMKLRDIVSAIEWRVSAREVRI